MRESPCVGGSCTQAGAGRTGSEPVAPCLILGLTRFDGHPSSGVCPRKDVRPWRAWGRRLRRVLLSSPGHRIEPPRRAQLRDGFAALTRRPPPEILVPVSRRDEYRSTGRGLCDSSRAGVLTPFDQRFTVILPRGSGAYGAGGVMPQTRDWEWEQSECGYSAPTNSRAQLVVEGSYAAETAVISRCSRCACDSAIDPAPLGLNRRLGFRSRICASIPECNSTDGAFPGNGNRHRCRSEQRRPDSGERDGDAGGVAYLGSGTS
jgi:hypothetical protein